MAMISTSFRWPLSSSRLRKASAGGQLEQHSEVNNSRTTGCGRELSRVLALGEKTCCAPRVLTVRKAIRIAGSRDRVFEYIELPPWYEYETSEAGKGVRRRKKKSLTCTN